MKMNIKLRNTGVCLVIITFLWSNLVWAGGVEWYKLSAPSQVTAIVPVAKAFVEGREVISKLVKEGITSKDEFYRRLQDELRAGKLTTLTGIPCLVFPDQQDRTKLAYYVFSPKESYFSRITTDPNVDDSLWRFLNLVGMEKIDISAVREFHEGGKIYYQQVFAIIDKEREFINICLKNIYSEWEITWNIRNVGVNSLMEFISGIYRIILRKGFRKFNIEDIMDVFSIDRETIRRHLAVLEYLSLVNYEEESGEYRFPSGLNDESIRMICSVDALRKDSLSDEEMPEVKIRVMLVLAGFSQGRIDSFINDIRVLLDDMEPVIELLLIVLEYMYLIDSERDEIWKFYFSFVEDLPGFLMTYSSPRIRIKVLEDKIADLKRVLLNGTKGKNDLITKNIFSWFARGKEEVYEGEISLELCGRYSVEVTSSMTNRIVSFRIEAFDEHDEILMREWYTGRVTEDGRLFSVFGDWIHAINGNMEGFKLVSVDSAGSKRIEGWVTFCELIGEGLYEAFYENAPWNRGEDREIKGVAMALRKRLIEESVFRSYKGRLISVPATMEERKASGSVGKKSVYVPRTQYGRVDWSFWSMSPAGAVRFLENYRERIRGQKKGNTREGQKYIFFKAPLMERLRLKTGKVFGGKELLSNLNLQECSLSGLLQNAVTVEECASANPGRWNRIPYQFADESFADPSQKTLVWTNGVVGDEYALYDNDKVIYDNDDMTISWTGVFPSQISVFFRPDDGQIRKILNVKYDFKTNLFRNTELFIHPDIVAIALSKHEEGLKKLLLPDSSARTISLFELINSSLGLPSIDQDIEERAQFNGLKLDMNKLSQKVDDINENTSVEEVKDIIFGLLKHRYSFSWHIRMVVLQKLKDIAKKRLDILNDELLDDVVELFYEEDIRNDYLYFQYLLYQEDILTQLRQRNIFPNSEIRSLIFSYWGRGGIKYIYKVKIDFASGEERVLAMSVFWPSKDKFIFGELDQTDIWKMLRLWEGICTQVPSLVPKIHLAMFATNEWCSIPIAIRAGFSSSGDDIWKERPVLILREFVEGYTLEEVLHRCATEEERDKMQFAAVKVYLDIWFSTRNGTNGFFIGDPKPENIILKVNGDSIEGKMIDLDFLKGDFTLAQVVGRLAFYYEPQIIVDAISLFMNRLDYHQKAEILSDIERVVREGKRIDEKTQWILNRLLDISKSLPLAKVYRYIYLNKEGFGYDECADGINESVELVKRAMRIFCKLGFVDIMDNRIVPTVKIREDKYSGVRDIFERYNTADDIPDIAEELLLILEKDKDLMEIRDEDRRILPLVQRLKAVVIFYKEVLPLVYGLRISDSEKEELEYALEKVYGGVPVLYKIKMLYYVLQIASGEGLSYEDIRQVCENIGHDEKEGMIQDAKVLWSISPEGVEADLMDGKYTAKEIYQRVHDGKSDCCTRTGKMIAENLMGMWERNLVILGRDIEVKWRISISDASTHQNIKAPPCIHVKGEFYYRGEKIGQAVMDVDSVSASVHTCHFKVLKKGHGLATEMAARLYLAADFVNRVFGLNTKYAHAYFVKTRNEVEEEDYWTKDMWKKVLEEREVRYQPFTRFGLEKKILAGQHHLNGYSGRYNDHIGKLDEVVANIKSHWKNLFYEERIPYVYGERAWEGIKDRIDFDRIELINRRDIADSSIAAICKYFNEHKEKRTLTPDITRRVAIASANLFDVYNNDSLIDILAEIMSLEDESMARPGTSAFFGRVIESLNDTFLLENRMVSLEVMARVIWVIANSKKGAVIKEKLESFGIISEEELLKRARKAAAERRFTGDKNKMKKVLIFSRITKGADVLITSVAMARLRQIFPNAEIVLIGIPKDKQLFAEGAGVHIVEIDYERRGSFISRLESWASVANLIREEVRGMNKDEYIVVDCDTRVGQTASLPCTDNIENYYFLFSVLQGEEIESGNIKNLAQIVNEWIDDIFGRGSFEYPWVNFSEDDKNFAGNVKKNFNTDGRHLISISVGVGGAGTKKPGDGFDLFLLKNLSALPDTTIFLDKGTEEYDEPAYVTGLVGELRKEGKIIADITYDTEKNMYIVQYNTPEGNMHTLTGNDIRDINLPAEIIPSLVTWHGSLGAFGALIGVSEQYVGYDSCFGHVAGALGIPETIIFCGAVNDIFFRRWVPFGRSGLSAMKVSEERRGDWNWIIDEVKEKLGVVPVLPVLEIIPDYVNIEDFKNVLFGIKKIAEVGLKINEQQIKDIEYFLRVYKYTTGRSIKFFNQGDGRYYIYDENYLRYLVQKGTAEGTIAEETLYLCATQSGLEQEILRQMADKEGIFYGLSGIANTDDDYRIRLKQKIPIDVLFMPSYKRPSALRRALELQTNNMRMFGHTHIPILVCSNANPDEAARFMSDEDVSEFKKYYNVDNPREKKWSELDRIIVDDFRKKGFNVTYIDWNVRNRIIDDAAPVIAAKYKKPRDEIRRILETIMASNISGIRNFTILIGNGARMISVDDDALPKMRVPKREVLERILDERQRKAALLKQRFNEELSHGGDRKELIRKYYSYSEDGSTGLIPQALGQIIRKDDTPDYWRFNDILRDEDDIYQGTLPPYLIASEDTMMQDRDTDSYEYDEWDIDYMRILSETLSGPAISPDAGLVFSHDKRGVAGSIAGQDLLKMLLGKTIGIATTHFNHDQDTSGEAQLDAFIERGARINDLNGYPLKVIHLEVNGFSNPNAQFCFNTTSIDNRVFPVPTIGELYRTEEPYYSYSVRAATGRIIAWSRTVGGHHRLEASTRPNVPHQILNEEAAMVAWRLYDKAVRDTEEYFGNDYNNPGERMRYLGERFIEYGKNYELDDWARGRMTMLQERIVKKIGDIVERAGHETEHVRKNLYGVVGELLIEFVIPQSNTSVIDKDTVVYIREGWPIKIIEKRIGEQRERIVEIAGDFDASIILRLDEEVKREFLNKVTGMIKKQVVDDGLTFMFWPDLVEAESKELVQLAEALSVLLGREIDSRWMDVDRVLYGEFSKKIEEFTEIRFNNPEDLRIDRGEAERLIYGYLKQVALGLAKLNKPISEITEKEFNRLFGVRHIVLAGGLGQRYSPKGIWHKALGIVGEDKTNIQLAVSGAYSSKGARTIIIITTRIMQAILKEGIDIDTLNTGIVDEKYIDETRKKELLPEGAILVWRKPEEGGGYGTDFMRGVETAQKLGILEDTAHVEIVFGEMAGNQDKRLSNTSLASYLKAVGEGYFITVAGRKDKVVKDKGTFVYDEEGRLVALTDWKRLNEEERKNISERLERDGYAYVNANCGVYRREIIQYFNRFVNDTRFRGIDPKTGETEYIPWDLVRFIAELGLPVGVMNLENAPSSVKDMARQNKLNAGGLTLYPDQAYRRGRVDIKSEDVRIGDGTYLEDVVLSGETYIGDGWAVVNSIIENSCLEGHDLKGYMPPFKGRTNAKSTIEDAVIENAIIPAGRIIPKGARIEGIMPEEMRLAWDLLGDETLKIEDNLSSRTALSVLKDMGLIDDTLKFSPWYLYERLFNALDNTIEAKFVFSLGSSKRVFTIKLPKETKGRQEEIFLYYLSTYLYNLMVSRGADAIGVYTEDEEFTGKLLDILSITFPDVEEKVKPRYSHIIPLLEKVYGKKFRFYKSTADEIEAIEYPNVDIKEETSLQLFQAVRSLGGTIAGIDAGGTDIKVVIYKDGKLVYAKEHIWDPKKFTEAEQHIGVVEKIIKDGLIECGLNVEELQVIGISWPDIIIGGRVIPLSSKVNGLRGKDEELKRISNLKDEISRRFGNIPVSVVNDGNIGAFWAGVELGKGNLIGLSMGTSCGVGYIDREGKITDFLTDMGSTVLNMTKEHSTAHNYSGVFGVAQKHLSQDGVFRLARELGLDLPKFNNNSEKLKYIQSLLNSEEPDIRSKAEEIFREIGRYLACFMEQIYLYFDESGTRNIVLFGRVIKGQAGRIIISTARQFLREDMNIYLAPEITDNPDADRFGQAIGAVYLGYKKALKRKMFGLVRALAERGITAKIKGKLLKEIESPEVLMRHIVDYTPLKNPLDIIKILEDRLRGDGVFLYNAVFNQEEFLNGLPRPINIVMFRGGRGIGELTQFMKYMPHIEISAVLGATDDGRSWYYAAQDFNATGVPDCGKTLLDLAGDKDTARFLGMRIKGEREIEKLIEEFEQGIKDIEPGKMKRILLFLKEFTKRLKEDYSWSRFSLDNIPLRSLVLVGAAWHYNGNWQRAADEVGRLLGIKLGRRVAFSTYERMHLAGLTGDGTIYFTETGINEHPKKEDFIGLWLFEKKPDIDMFAKMLGERGIDLERVEIPKNIPAEFAREIDETVRVVKQKDRIIEAAYLLADLSLSEGGTTTTNPPTLDIIQNADVIIYGPSSLESNIGSGLLPHGVRDAIRRNEDAVKIFFVNPTIENEPADITAMDGLEKLFRYITGMHVYHGKPLDWEGGYIDYILGRGLQHTPRDPKKRYIPFNDRVIEKDTDGSVVPIPLNLEWEEPILKERRDYRGHNREYGFYSVPVMKENIIALWGVKKAGFRIENGSLVRDTKDDNKNSPIAKKPASKEQNILWQTEIKDGMAEDDRGTILNKVIERIKEEYGPGILAVVDDIRVVNDIDPLSDTEMIKENGRNILLLGANVFDSDELLYIVLEHKLRKSIMAIVPCENDAIRELSMNFVSLKVALEKGMRIDRAKLARLDARLQFFEVLELIQSEGDIIPVAIEHMRAMPYYAKLFEQFSFAGEWTDKIKDAGDRYQAALQVFNDIIGAKRVVGEVETNIRVVKTFTGKRRIVGLEGLSRFMQRAIGVVAKIIWGEGAIRNSLTEHIDQNKANLGSRYWIVISRERKEQMEGLAGKTIVDEQIRVLEGIEVDGRKLFKVVGSISEVTDTDAFSRDNPRVIYAFDLEDWDGLEQREDMLYIPLMYTSGALYLAAQLVLVGGNVGEIKDKLFAAIFKGICGAILGREITDEEAAAVYRLVFRTPWRVERITENLGALRTGIVQIQIAA